MFLEIYVLNSGDVVDSVPDDHAGVVNEYKIF
jgi:hypothetical protein